MYELSSSQWNFYIEDFSSETTLWNQGGAVIFNKKYSYLQLNDALNELIEKHDSTRLRIKEINHRPYVCAETFQPIKSPCYSFHTIEELRNFVSDYLNSPIDIHTNMFNVAIFETPEHTGFFANIHHLIIDGMSMIVMAEHINKYLKKSSEITRKIQSYEEIISKDKIYKNSKRYTTDKTFWLTQFSSFPVCSIFERKKTSLDYLSDEVNFTISTYLFEKIKTFCRTKDISIQTYFNTVYATYISRCFDFNNFTIGIPVLNRTTEAELNTVGLYMHIVPLLVNISDGSFLENALNVEDSQMNLLRHQKFTQYDIKQLLKEEGRQLNSLFDIVADYQVFEKKEDYEFEFIYSNSLSVPIEIHMQSFGEKKHNLKIRYRTSMFSENEIQTMLNSIISIAEDALENPEKSIRDLEMLSPEEKQKILYEFNDTAHTYPVPEDSTIYSLFEKTAKENIDKVCITTADKSIRFGELLRLSENLDTEIRSITGDKKSVIAVIAERSVEMYAAIYGIIRGGNAYLPIDPEYPQERIEYILKNSGAAAVVAQGKFVHLAGNTSCIDMTAFVNSSNGHNVNVLPCIAKENDTAYVIYTSGSTGNPKGAKVSHKSAVNRILWMHDKYPLEENSLILQKTPYTFDVSVWEIFWWGMYGGSLAASKPGEHFLPAKILDETYSNKVTHLHFVPSVFELFLNYLEKNKDELYKFDSVKYVFLSGEALSASLVERFYKMFSYEKVTLHNLYGPTECAVDVTYFDCTPDDVDPVPIGKPIYNTQIYVVDKFMNLQPVGIKGELCIAGVNVGQGYLNNEELTAEKFIDNPFGEGKLYKTGDLAYWREDGQLIFCGRMDSQIKLNGQRIEIGEIEAVISSINGVDCAAAVVKKINAKDMLVAFYAGKENNESVIKETCLTKLPRYMVPNIIKRLDSLPLNNSGKLDRKALAQIEIAVEQSVENEAPINNRERLICETFEKVLGKQNINRNSDFFEMGGTSLSMISLLSEKGFEDITAAEFIANSTPARLALVMNDKKNINLEYLEPLYLANKTEQVLVLLPFAGGGVEAFSNFINSLKKKSNNTSVYFIRYLHSEAECKSAAKEIANVLSGKEIFIYSHCVGSAIAVQILSFLETYEVSVKHYFAGASIPPAKPTKKNIWNIVPDSFLKQILSKAGAQLCGLSDEKLSELLRCFRKDTDFANVSYTEARGKIQTPVTVIISKKDIFTRNYRSAEKLWQKYFEKVKNVSFIDSPSHYFQSDNSDELTEIILSLSKHKSGSSN